MDKEQIKKELTEQHAAFTDYINGLSDTAFVYSKNKEKWSAGQQLQHIYLSVRPVNMALLLPKFFVRLLFGKPRRKRTYDELVAAYHRALSNGGKASSAYIPNSIAIGQKQKLITDVTTVVASLNTKIDTFSEEDLDNYILPHPLIGRTTIREMLYFTIYHVQHHHKAVRENID
jgi:hypothetical protein